MARSTRLTLTFLVTAALAAPSLASAQAVPRPATSGGSSGSAGSGSSSSGSSSSAGGSSSGSESRPRSGESSSSRAGDNSPSRMPSRIPSTDSARRGTASAATRSPQRVAPSPGGVAVGSGSSANSRSSDSSSSNRVGAVGSGVDISGSRNRNGRPVSGLATARTPDTVGTPVSFPLFGPWGRWYPWGWNVGFNSYNPWRYGATRWMYGRYGLWYDPYSYYPYYDDYYYGGGYSSSSREDEYDRIETGSLRLKVSPSMAKVYIDGALVGVVDDFDGLRNHLEIEAGAHQLELRAEGYETYIADVTVDPGKTRTERITLKKVK